MGAACEGGSFSMTIEFLTKVEATRVSPLGWGGERGCSQKTKA
jgi:hypothetical protein